MGDSRHSKRRVGEPLVNLTINGDDSVRLFRGGMSQKKKKYIYIYGYWVKSGPHGTAFINCTCMFEGYIYLPSTHIYQRHS